MSIIIFIFCGRVKKFLYKSSEKGNFRNFSVNPLPTNGFEVPPGGTKIIDFNLWISINLLMDNRFEKVPFWFPFSGTVIFHCFVQSGE